jgi:hypothetical protein
MKPADTADAFVNGYAVVATRHHSNVLRSFHTDKCDAEQHLHRTIDTGQLIILPAEIGFALNGNVRIWRSTSNSTCSYHPVGANPPA